MRYRIDSAGTLELVSIDAQYSTTSTVHLVYTSTRPVGATLKFALLQAYKARLAAGSTERFTVTGSCSGTATLSETAPASANFEGSTVQATTQTALLNLTNCTPATSAVTGTNYYDVNSLLLGAATPGLEYAKVTGAAVALPAQVQVGDTGTLATLNLYTDNTTAVATGRRVLELCGRGRIDEYGRCQLHGPHLQHLRPTAIHAAVALSLGCQWRTEVAVDRFTERNDQQPASRLHPGAR